MTRHLQADYQEPGSAPEPYARQSSIGYLYFFYLWLFTLSQKKTTCNPRAHLTWKCTTLTCEIPNFFHLTEGLYCTCIFRTCVFHPCGFVLTFSVHAFSILAKCSVLYLHFPYLRFPVPARCPSCRPTYSIKALKGFPAHCKLRECLECSWYSQPCSLGGSSDIF